MQDRAFSCNMAMLTRKFYCHKCGDKLVRNPRTRIIKRGDPDYERYRVTDYFSDVKLTVYDLKCCACDRIITGDDGYVIEKIQKTLGKHILTDEEILENEENAKAAIAKKAKITDVIVKSVFIAALIALIVYFFVRA
jgi:hypothetical protein